MRALLYCRTPEDDAVDASLDAQQEMLVREALERGFDYQVIRDDGPSAGGARGEDKLAEALDLLDTHQADVLMAVRLDWLSENAADVSALVDRSKRKGWGIILSGDGLDTTASGGLGPRLHAIATQEERDLVSRRTREAMQRQKAEGALFGRPVDPGFVATYREVLAMVGRGMSYNAVARSLNEDGISTAKGRTWYASTVKAMVESETARRLGRSSAG